MLPDAGACVDCPKRTGFDTVLFEGMAAGQVSCTAPKCYRAKLVQRNVAARPKLVQISTAYGQPKEDDDLPMTVADRVQLQDRARRSNRRVHSASS